MTKKLWGLPIQTNSGKVNPKTLSREMALGTGANPSSERAPVRYFQDPTTARVYPAEQRLRSWVSEKRPGTELRWLTGDLPGVQAYIDNVISWPWSQWSPMPCTVQMYEHPVPTYRSGILMPTNHLAWRELYVLHELGHHFARQQHGGDHGLQWQRAFRALLADCMDLKVREMFDRFLDEEYNSR